MALREHELKNAYIGEYVENWATQGPCPDGFHVPLSSEWVSVCNLGISTWGIWYRDAYALSGYLMLPMAGFRSESNSNVGSAGYVLTYWSSNINNAMDAYSSNISPSSGGHAGASGRSIRPFKNEAVVPDSNWTAIYQPGGSAGIYHNSDLGLISLSGDGSNWITIADKNLGAVNIGDYGYYYQRGNNYGFPNTGSVTTSSTQVDASSYGPGNYYSSSTFILNGWDWDSSSNANLRGGEDGNVPV